jgi:hypothetical protein
MPSMEFLARRRIPESEPSTVQSNETRDAQNLIPSTAGHPLDRESMAPLERHFGADLSEVRVHTDAEAAESANRLDALAYTHGREIYFAPGMYAPGSSSGRKLLAHEVAHVVQQSAERAPAIAGKSARGAKIAPADDALEGEAERHAQQFAGGAGATMTDEEERKKWEMPQIQRSSVIIQRQRASPQGQSSASFDATAQSIIHGAQDNSRPAWIRGVAAVWRIIHEYYPSEGTNVNSVTFDNTQAGTGLATSPHPAKNPVSGRIFVGDAFLAGVQDPRGFAHHVLQVGHELEHIRQFRDPALGPSAAKKDEREFLAFYHEALAVPIPHTGRFQHGTRIAVIDQALGYYNCLASSSDTDKQNATTRYVAYQQELLTRRATEIADMRSKGYVNVPTAPPPAACRRQ